MNMNNNNSLGAQIPEFGNRIQLALDRAVVDDLAAELTLRTARQELGTVQHQLEEFLLGPTNSKAKITAARAEVTEATATRDRALADWRITTEVLQAAKANFRQAFLPIARVTAGRSPSRASRSSCCASGNSAGFRTTELFNIIRQIPTTCVLSGCTPF
jgi:hypothetical protein